MRGILQAHMMTLESVVAKLMWILPQTGNLDEIKQLFYQPVARDLLRFDSPDI